MHAYSSVLCILCSRYGIFTSDSRRNTVAFDSRKRSLNFSSSYCSNGLLRGNVTRRLLPPHAFRQSVKNNKSLSSAIFII